MSFYDRRTGYPNWILVTLVLGLANFEGCSGPKPPTPVLAPSPWVQGPPLSTNPFDQAIFHKCYDGDTCTFSLPGLPNVFGDHIAIRLVGIDAPEIKGHCQREKDLATKARDYLNQRLKQAHVIQIRHTARDKYFRVLAELFADGEDLSELLLKQGLAVPYHGQTKTKDWCAQ